MTQTTREHQCVVCSEWADPTGEVMWKDHRAAMRAAGWSFPFPAVCPDCAEPIRKFKEEYQ